MSDIVSKHAALRTKLASLLAKHSDIVAVKTLDQLETMRVLHQADVVITHIEVNSKHGTGVFVSRLFAGRTNIFSIRSRNLYDGEHHFGEMTACLSYEGMSRLEMFASMINELNGTTVRRILCIPYYPDDVRSALMVQELFRVPLCTYIMDDQNIYSNGISDELMSELLQKSSLRLAISHEIQNVYSQKFGLKFALLPPGVPGALLSRLPHLPTEESYDNRKGVMIGNIWGSTWLKLLRSTIQGTGLQIVWYCNGGSKCSWLDLEPQALAQDGIALCAPIEEEDELVAQLRRYSFAVVPSGTLDERDDNLAIAHLSLPSRIPFILATSNTPIIVLGSAKTAAARFVERFKIGVVCDYDTTCYQQAVEYVTSAEVQYSMRQNAANLADCFVADNMVDWIWESLEKGDNRDLEWDERLPLK